MDQCVRIGRADHVYTKPFEAIEGTDWWRCETPDYENYTHFTITDNADDTAPIDNYPEGANRLYEYFTELCRREIPLVQTGIFGADMKVELVNDGPVTIIVDSKLKF
jgi:hypothetical protein